MSTPYGMPPASPRPPAAPQKNRTGLYIGVACGCLLLIAALVAAGGIGLWLFSSGDGEEGPTSGPTTTQSPSEDPATTDPTDEPTEDDPVETPSEDPSADPTSQPGASFTIDVSTPEEGTTLETSDETLETENGKFIGVAVTITNNGSEEIGLGTANFAFFDAAGEQHRLIYGSFSTTGPQIAPGEEATALLYADVPTEMQLASISYTDEVGTGGVPITIPVD
jgi:hypothetical protein